MPNPPTTYIHCQVLLELPIIRRCETEVWYMEFATCQDCTKDMLKMTNPSVIMQIDGETLKTLLRGKSSRILKATVMEE